MKLAHVLLAVPIVFAAACVADVSGTEEDVGDVAEPGLRWGNEHPHNPITDWVAAHPGRCTTACATALAGGCPAHARCEDAVYDNIECAGVTLKCPAALNAASGNLVGMEVCVYSCENPDLPGGE
jgi:hypothetical protein